MLDIREIFRTKYEKSLYSMIKVSMPGWGGEQRPPTTTQVLEPLHSSMWVLGIRRALTVVNFQGSSSTRGASDKGRHGVWSDGSAVKKHGLF